MPEDDVQFYRIDDEEGGSEANEPIPPPRRRIPLPLVLLIVFAAFVIGGLLGQHAQTRADEPIRVSLDYNVRILKDLYGQIGHDRWFAAWEYSHSLTPDAVLKAASMGDPQAMLKVQLSAGAGANSSSSHFDCLDLVTLYNHWAVLIAGLPGGTEALQANDLPVNLPTALPDNICFTGNASSFVPGYMESHSERHHR